MAPLDTTLRFARSAGQDLHPTGSTEDGANSFVCLSCMPAGAWQADLMSVTPLGAALDVLDRATALLQFDGGTEKASLVEYDVRRQALALGVAALDTWMHWALARVDLTNLSNRMARLEVPFGALVEMGTASVVARQSGLDDRPSTRARNVLREKLLTMTFQSSRQWDIGCGMLGASNGLTLIAGALQPALTRSQVEQRLNTLSHRRNRIVHEGDLLRQSRPRKVVRSALPRTEVDADLLWIRDFLHAAEAQLL